MTDRISSLLSLKTYLINLDRADERLRSMTIRLADGGLSYERVPAVDGSRISLPIAEFDETGYRLRHGRRPNTAEIGCYLSHIECARRLLASQHEFALVLEDDLELDEDFRDVLTAATRTSHAWDLLRLSSVSSGRKYGFAKLTAQRDIAIALTREKGSGAYLINRRAARWFVNDMMPMRLPFDLAFDLEFGSGVKVAFVSPMPANQQTGVPSQIQARRRSYHLSRWHYMSVLPYRAAVEVCRFANRLSKLIVCRVAFGPAVRTRKIRHHERGKTVSGGHREKML